MHYIESPKNEQIKQIKKLTLKKYQRREGKYLLEDWHLVADAIHAQADIEMIYTTSKYVNEPLLHRFYDKMTLISPEVARALATTETPQGIFAIVGLPNYELPQHFEGAWLLLDRVQDPGNVGTMVRSADAAGFTGVILGEGSVDEYNPKVLRSMQGSQFHIAVLHADLNEVVDRFKSEDIPVYGSELNDQAVPYREIEPRDNFALIVGNEGHGMSADLLTKTYHNLYIPIKGKAESLNVAVAAGILMFWLIK